MNYIVEHFKNCRKCEVVDNNTISIFNYIDKMKKILKSDKKEIKEAYKSYINCAKYEPKEYNRVPYMQIMRIKEGDYENAIIISWVIE